MRTLLICHDAAPLDREGLARWLGSFSTLAGTVVVGEPRARLRRRIAREIGRIGPWRFLDVLAFRAYYRLLQAIDDRRWEMQELERLRARFPDRPDAPEMAVSSPNSPEAEAFIRRQQPDLVIARCKTLLQERVFTIPRLGTYVMHPGICPEYRNAHGCFWALARGDHGNVGTTLIRIDRGVDTGPVFGYFRVDAGTAESHIVTQHRAVLDHLDPIRDKLLEIEAGTAAPIDTTGRRPAVWGQPWLSAHLRLKTRSAVNAGHETAAALMYHDIVASAGEEPSGFPGRDAALYKVTRELFDEHLRTIAKTAPRTDVLITLDDGGASALMAADRLERQGFTGHFFITTNYIGTPGFVDERDIGELRRRGHTVGSHSCSHPLRMGHCSWPQLLDEWTRSRQTLEDILGEPVRVASVPGGDFAPQVAEAAARAGFTTLFTSEPTRERQSASGLTLIGRYTIQRLTTAKTIAGLVSGARLPCAREAIVWNAKKISKRLGGEQYLKVRKLLLRHGDEVRWGDRSG
jgi:peptidoglycan/xylan/chitin deacetylase (PgdA/CDA1 family)